MKDFPSIVKEYRQKQQLSLRDFAAALSDGQAGDGISYQSIRNWETGVYTPSIDLFMALAMKTGDWRRDFAFDCLAALRPDIYAPAED